MKNVVGRYLYDPNYFIEVLTGFNRFKQLQFIKLLKPVKTVKSGLGELQARWL